MTGIERANGHKPVGLMHMMHPALLSAPHPKQEGLPFDLAQALAAVVGVAAEVPGDAFTAPTLGTERSGNGVVIGDDGLIVTIGYLIVEAATVNVIIGGKAVPAHVVGYDHATGLGLLRANQPLGVAPLMLGSSSGIKAGDAAVIAAYGGEQQSISGRVAAKREFAGSWEYLLDEAIFTVPLHPSWGGAALISGATGKLMGIGSLYIEETVPGKRATTGNMFVPIDLLPPILNDLIRHGRPDRPPRPWLGVYSAEAEGHLVVTSVQNNAPADQAGLHPGDVVEAVNGQELSGEVADFYRRIWAAGTAGTNLTLGIRRGEETLHISIRTADRLSYLKLPRRH